MIPTDELLSDDEILNGLDVMVDIGDSIPDDHIGFLKSRVTFLEAYADWIDIMRAKEEEYDLELDDRPSATLKAMGIGCADRSATGADSWEGADLWGKRAAIISTLFDAAIWCHQQQVARRAANQ